MKSQKELIHTINWDVLLVIDAVRYDYFKKFYSQIFTGGKLEKTISSTTFTFGWIMDTFGEKFNGTFVCTEPIKDSIHDITNKMKHGNTIDVEKYFTKVVDCNVNVEPGLVYPIHVFDSVRRLLDNGEKRVVAKFIQVHDPYIYWIKKGVWGDGCKQYIKGNWRKLLYEVVSDEFYWKFCEKIGWPPENWLAYLWLKHGKEGIIKGYCQDLIMMLKKCNQLVKEYPNIKFVITSDHGERLGEKGRYSHGGKRTKIIKEVPWFESSNQ